MKPIQIRMPEGSRTITLMLNIEIVPVAAVSAFKPTPALKAIRKAKRTVKRKTAKRVIPKREQAISAYKEAFAEKEIPTNVFKRRPRAGCACIAVDANYFTHYLTQHGLKARDLAKHSRVMQSEISRMSNTMAPHRKDHSRYRRVSLNTFLKVYNHLPKDGLDINKLLHPFNEPHSHCSPIYGGPRG